MNSHDLASELKDDLASVPCPLCDGTNLTLHLLAPSHYGPEKLTISRCLDCGMLFTNPQSVSYEHRVRRRGLLDRYFNPIRLEKAKRLATFHLSYLAQLAPGRRVLDFGCGEGTFVRQAKDEGWDAIGVDLNEDLIDGANEFWKFNALHSLTLDDVARRGWRFDAIYSNQVFEHLRRPVEVGRALVGMLAPRGAIYLEVPNANQLFEQLNPGSTLDPTSHFNHFTVDTLARLIERVGCEPAYATGAPGMFRFWAKIGTGTRAVPFARVARQILPNVGSGACVIGRKRSAV
jgi:SAM-dependent methyltransferase